MAQKQHLYLVDGSAYIFRAYHRLPPLTNPEGTPVGAVYGYTTMLWKLADDLHKADGPTHLAVILDKSSHSFRNDLYDQYKANRPDPPEDLVPQFPFFRQAVHAFNMPCIEMDGYEAMGHIRDQARFKKLPILALTAKAMKDDRAKCIDAGANDYCSKPIDMIKLTSLLRVWLHK